MQSDYPEIILASASAARAAILGNAGVRFHQQPSTLNEREEHRDLGASYSAETMALHLARRKADIVLEMEPGAVVIGADQVLVIDGELLQKPVNHAEARHQLMRLRGKPHQLHSAAVILHNGSAKEFVDVATLTMRDFSDAFLDWYMDSAGEGMLTSVGAYHFEGLGIHLFADIDGDYFTILGLPIVPILDELRRLKVLIS